MVESIHPFLRTMPLKIVPMIFLAALILLLWSPSGAQAIGDCAASATRTAVPPGVATTERECTTAPADGIDASTNLLAILYNAPTGETPHIRHTGDGGEIHILGGTVNLPSTGTAGAAVSLISTAGDALRITSATDTDIRNRITTSESHAIQASSSAAASIFMTLAGSSRAESADGSALSVTTTAAGAIDIDINGGTYESLGALGTGHAVIELESVSGTIALDIASGAEVQGNGGRAARALLLTTSGAATVTNAGSITGRMFGSAGGVSFTNQAGGRFVGRFTLGAGADSITNEGDFTLTGDVDFGGGTDILTLDDDNSRFILDFSDTAAVGTDEEIDVAGLEEIHIDGGTLLFRLQGLARSPNPQTFIMNENTLDLGSVLYDIVEGNLEITLERGSIPESGFFPLIAGTALLTPQGAARLTSRLGVVAIGTDLLGNDFLGIQLQNRQICGGSIVTGTPAGVEASDILSSRYARCASTTDDAYQRGIIVNTDEVALVYDTDITGTPYIRHTGNAGEILFLQGRITLPSTSSSGAAVSVVGDAGRRGTLHILTAANTMVQNMRTADGSHGISASSQAGNIVLDISGSSSTVGGSSSAISAITFGRSSTITANLLGGRHSATGGQDASAAVVSLQGVLGVITLDIGPRAFLQASGSALRAIHLVTDGTTTTTHRGVTLGDYLGSDGADVFRNSGFFQGLFGSGAGNDRLENLENAVLTFNRGDANFGSGNDDVLINHGFLTIDVRNVGDEEISMPGLERFVQNGGFIRFVLPEIRGDLNEITTPLDLVSAVPTFTSGRLDILTAAVPLPEGGFIPLIKGARILEDTDISGLSSPYGVLQIRLRGGDFVIGINLDPPTARPVTVDPDATQIDPDNPIFPPPDPDDPFFNPPTPTPPGGPTTVINGYDTITQTAYSSHRAFSKQLLDAECAPLEQRNYCVWGDIGGRFLRHRAKNRLRYNEDTTALYFGARTFWKNAMLSSAIGYENTEFDIQTPDQTPESSAEGNRFLGAFELRSRDNLFFDLFDLDLQLRATYTELKYSRRNSPTDVPRDASPNVTSYAASLGGETVLYYDADRDWSMTHRLEAGAIFTSVGRFFETGGTGAFYVEPKDHTIYHVQPSTQLNYVFYKGTQGILKTSLALGVDAVFNRSKAEINATSEGRRFTSKSSLDDVFFDAGVGITFRHASMPSALVQIAYEGGVSSDADTQFHRINARLSFAF